MNFDCQVATIFSDRDFCETFSSNIYCISSGINSNSECRITFSVSTSCLPCNGKFRSYLTKSDALSVLLRHREPANMLLFASLSNLSFGVLAFPEKNILYYCNLQLTLLFLVYRELWTQLECQVCIARC